jgi:hypothetical protein
MLSLAVTLLPIVAADVGTGTHTHCDNNCANPQFASDNVCDDGGRGADFNLCSWGTDCTDCGPRTGGIPTDQKCGSIYGGSCPALTKRSGKWIPVFGFPEEQCCADKQAECCVADAGPIIGIILGCCVGFFLCVVACCCCCQGCPLAKAMAEYREHDRGTSTGGASTELATTSPVGVPITAVDVASAVRVAPPSPTQQMDVVVPAGMQAGSTFTVATPSGTMQVTVPDGCGPGSKIRTEVPRVRLPPRTARSQ